MDTDLESCSTPTLETNHWLVLSVWFGASCGLHRNRNGENTSCVKDKMHNKEDGFIQAIAKGRTHINEKLGGFIEASK